MGYDLPQVERLTTSRNDRLRIARKDLTITNIIVGITCLVSLLALRYPVATALLIFHPVTMREQQQWYRLLTSGFIHGDVMHLAINMFVLWSFGNVIESYYASGYLGAQGALKYMLLYFGQMVQR